jgi:VWFA-related protein
MELRRTPLALASLATLLTAAVAADYPADRTAIHQAPQQSLAPTLQVYSRETFVDIVVTDAQGRPVHGLKQSDFTLFEDGKEMHPRSFAEHRSDEPLPPAPMQVTQSLPPNTFTNLTQTPSDRPINILLLDSLNTPAATQLIVQRQMLAMVDKMPPGTRMAVIRMTSYLSMLQGITTDREQIKAALENTKSAPGASSFEDPGQDLATGDDPNILAIHQDDNDPSRDERLIKGPQPDPSCIRGNYIDVTMKQVTRFLSGMPGRKNLIWFTGLTSCPDPSMGSDIDLLARAHVTIFPIDGRGAGGGYPSRHAGAEHALMDAMATQTGGRASYGIEDLTGAALQVLDSGSNFYAFTYAPANQQIDGHFRTITVKVNQPGLQLVYRPGYYAGEPGKSLSGMKIKQATPVQAAMLRGGLEPTQILFKVQATPTLGIETALSPGNTPNSKKMKPPYRHYAFSYDIEIKDIAFTLSDGKYRADFEFGANVYDDNGDVVNSVSKEVRPVLTPEAYQSMLKSGARAHQEIDIPAKGEYFLRIAVHDLTSDRIGAVEVPTSSITPVPLPATASGK